MTPQPNNAKPTTTLAPIAAAMLTNDPMSRHRDVQARHGSMSASKGRRKPGTNALHQARRRACIVSGDGLSRLIAPGSKPADWFAGAAAEQFERTRGFSTAFESPSAVLAWLCKRPFTVAEMERRRVLFAARSGQRPEVPMRLCEAAADHLNADVWRAGRVPGTLVASQ